MPRLGGTVARLGRTAVLIVLAVIVLAAAVLLAVPQWREAVLPSSTVTLSAGPPAGWRQPSTAAPAQLPLEAAEPAPAPAASELKKAIADLPAGTAGRTGVVVVDPQTGRTLVSSGDRPMIPASTMKLLTSVAVLDTLGADRTFATSALLAGRSTVVLRGGGDPLLTDARTTGRASLADLAAKTAAALKRAGTDTVTLGYDATLFTGASWHPRWTENYQWSVGRISALSVDGGTDTNGKARRDPAAAAAKRFAARLEKAGIGVTSTRSMRTPSDADELAFVSSPPVQQLIEHTLRDSDNTAIETLARHTGIAAHDGADFGGAEQAVRTALKRLGLWRSGMRNDDSSGLSRENRVSPGVLAKAMRLVLTQDGLRSLIVGLPVGGVTGTLYDRFDDARERAGRGVVRAKTGSLRDVSTLAGYLITADGSPLAFAVMANEVTRPLATRDWIDTTVAAWSACGC